VEEYSADVTIEELSPVKRKLSFDVPWTEVKRELDSAYRQVGKKARIKGFRPGKVPRKVLEVHYREDAENEAVIKLITRRFVEAVEKNNIPVVSQPKIDNKVLEPDSNFCFSATVEIRPDVEPRDYTGLPVTRVEYEVTDRDVENRLDKLREMYALLEPAGADRVTVDGDYLVIDFEVTVDELLREELTTKNYTIQIGGGSFLPGFEEQLKGLKKGEEKIVNVTFPETYEPSDLAGRQGLFRVTVNDVLEKRIPPLDDEFVKNFDAFETVDNLREAARKSIVDEATAKTERDLRKSIISSLLEKHEFEVPSVWVEHQTFNLMADAERRMVSNGLKRERAMQTVLDMQENFRPHAELMVKTSLLLARIAEKESITADDSEVEERIGNLARLQGRPVEEVLETMRQNEGIEQLRDEIIEGKAMAFLVEKATVTVEKNPLSDLETESKENA
jgi:trigger factor